MRVASVVGVIAAGAFLAGCSSGRHLTSGDRKAIAAERQMLRDWRHDHALSVRQQWTEYPTPPTKEALRARATAIASAHHLRVIDVDLVSGDTHWARVVVEGAATRANANAVSMLLGALDPAPSTVDSSGVDGVLGGLFVSLRDRHGVPFVVAFRENAGGSSWARSKQLDPFVHGL